MNQVPAAPSSTAQQESKGVAHLSRTLCVNQRGECGGEIIGGVLLNLNKKWLKNYLFTQG